jgi:tetratricopeptide (TPR) repeat protein
MNLASWRGKLAMHEILISTYSQILLLFGQNDNGKWFSGDVKTLILGIVSSIIAALIIYGIVKLFARKRSKALKPFFSIFNEKTGKLKPDDVLGIRASENSGFVEKFYFERNYDKNLYNLINEGKNVLVTGEPLSGKSRLIYNTLKALGGFRVWIPDIVDFDNSIFPYLKSKKKSIVLFDDMDKYIGKQNIEGMISRLVSKGFIILATCKNGDELEILNNFLTEKSRDTFQERLEIKRMDDSELANVEKRAKSQKVSLKENQFNGTVGSLFYPLLIMKNRFDGYGTDRKCFLRAMKKLYMAGIYEGKADYSIERAKRICESDGLRKESHEWDSLMEELSKDGFVRRKDKNIAEIDDIYFQNLDNVGEIISFSFELDLDDVFEKILDLFKDDARALFLLGYKAGKVSLITHNIRSIKCSINANNQALEIYTFDKYPYNYATTQNNLGNVYGALSEIKDKVNNCKRAINAYNEALKVHTFGKYPYDYAMAQNNLGATYYELSLVEGKADNCRKAIDACNQALRVYTFDEYPYDYAMAQNNLGTAYQELSLVDDETEYKVDNCKNAINAYNEALRVYTFDKYPYQYATIQNNLGNAYWSLSIVEDKADNCMMAINAFNQALRVRIFDEYPYQYAMTQNNLGNAYQELSLVDDEIEYKGDNCKNGINAYNEALRVCTFDGFPYDYAMIQNNLGTAYWNLSEVEDKVINCKKAIHAYDEALKVYNPKDFPYQYEGVTRNRDEAVRLLSE